MFEDLVPGVELKRLQSRFVVSEDLDKFHAFTAIIKIPIIHYRKNELFQCVNVLQDRKEHSEWKIHLLQLFKFDWNRRLWKFFSTFQNIEIEKNY